jgi:DNA-binding transcriptional LysR family regulator
MADLDLTTLRLFVSCCETRNIARAAQQAHLVGSAVSKRLAQLEAQLGTRLLERRRHGVEPTPAGEAMLEHARAMLFSAQQAQQDLAALATGLRGQVRMLASASALAESLADDVAAFLRHPGHEGIRVLMEERTSPEIVRGVRDGQAAIGVCWDAADLSGLSVQPYRSDHLAVVVHADHPLAARPSLRFADTLDHEHVALPVATAVQTLLQRAAAAEGRVIAYRVIVSSFEAALRVVRANLALSVVPREVAHTLAQAWGLRVLTLDEPWARRRFALCCVDVARLPAAARLLPEHLSRQAQAQAPSSPSLRHDQAATPPG